MTKQSFNLKKFIFQNIPWFVLILWGIFNLYLNQSGFPLNQRVNAVEKDIEVIKEEQIVDKKVNDLVTGLCATVDEINKRTERIEDKIDRHIELGR